MVQNEIKMRKPKSRELIHALVQDWRLYVLLLPVVLWFALWAYKPMGGLLIAFKRYDSSLGIWMSEFKGIDNFVNLVAGVNKEQFWQAFRNTFVINAYSLVFGFPVPIILAVLFSEIGNGFVRKATQTATYLPHFLSEVTITGITIMLVRCSFHRCAGSPVSEYGMARGRGVHAVQGQLFPASVHSGGHLEGKRIQLHRVFCGDHGHIAHAV